MNRRTFLKTSGVSLLATTTLPQPARAAAARANNPIQKPAAFRVKPFELDEATVDSLQEAMRKGKETAASITKKYLERIEEIDWDGPGINSVIEINPDAISIARDLDKERKAKGPRGPLHGIPVLVKDNIGSFDRMMTTAGSLALLGSIPPRDAFVVQKLREAGAVLLGKTNLSEWANFRGDRSTSGWSGRGGQTNNPYVLDRNPSGSSSGSGAAVAANLCALAVGTETNGSIISPSTVCGVVGLKPTVGLISRSGIIPISHTQDTAGPMTRTVRDAALLLGAMAGEDPRDASTKKSDGKLFKDYTQFLDPNGLRGARLGVARSLFRSAALTEKQLSAALEQMKRMGAVLIDLSDDQPMASVGSAQRDVLLYEFKAGLNAYLTWLGSRAPVRSLKEVIEFNERNKETELLYFGQETFLRSEEKGPLTDKAYLEALDKCRRISRQEGIDATMDQHRLDAIVAPSGGPAGTTDHIHGDRGFGGSSSPAAIAGYPNITVPAGYLQGMPFGISFFGRAFSEPVLLKLAYAFEQATKVRQAPRFLKTI